MIILVGEWGKVRHDTGATLEQQSRLCALVVLLSQCVVHWVGNELSTI
jgi:hypothetical protein